MQFPISSALSCQIPCNETSLRNACRQLEPGPFQFFNHFTNNYFSEGYRWCKWDIPRLWIDSWYLQENPSFWFHFLNSILVQGFDQLVNFFNSELWSSSLKSCTSQAFTVVLLYLFFFCDNLTQRYCCPQGRVYCPGWRDSEKHLLNNLLNTHIVLQSFPISAFWLYIVSSI